MSETKDDGGCAFPREDYQSDGAPGQRGMSLRDYFAAAALSSQYTQHDSDPDRVAAWAYQIADAMIQERKL
jgi:hypothetical protein